MISGHVHLLSILSWGILVYQTSMSFLLHFILQHGVIFLQLILGYFYWHSNELFVNVPLMMIGYSLVVGKYKEKELLLFVKNSQLKSVLGREVRFVPLGKVEEGQLGVLGEESLN